MLRTTYTQLTRRTINRRAFSTQTDPAGNNSNALALAAAGALGIGGYMYYNSTSSSRNNSSKTSPSGKTEDNSDRVEKDSNDADKHWETKDKIDNDRFNTGKGVKGEAESKIDEFRKSSTDNLSNSTDEAKNGLAALKEKAGEQVENAKELAQEGVQGIQANLQQVQEKVSNVISKDK